MKNIVLTGTGSFMPDRVVKNEDFLNQEFYDEKNQKFEADNETIIRKFEEITGIKERRWLEDDLNTDDMGFIAAKRAIDDAGIDKEELDYVIVGQNAGQVIKGLEDGIRGRKAGDKLSLTISPEDAYGEARDDLVREIPRSNFPEGMDIQPGMPFEAQSPHGPVRFTVKEVRDDVVIADFNHPLAGETLHFDIKILEVREPSFAEMSAMGSSCGCDTEPQGGCGTCGGCS